MKRQEIIKYVEFDGESVGIIAMSDEGWAETSDMDQHGYLLNNGGNRSLYRGQDTEGTEHIIMRTNGDDSVVPVIGAEAYAHDMGDAGQPETDRIRQGAARICDFATYIIGLLADEANENQTYLGIVRDAYADLR